MKLLVLLEKLHVCTTTDQGVFTDASVVWGRETQRSRLTLRLNLILNHQSLALIVDLLGEFGGNSVVGCSVLHNKALVALHSLQNRRLLDLPGTNVGPFLLGPGVILFGVRRSPSGFPAIGELLEEGSFESGRLERASAMRRSDSYPGPGVGGTATYSKSRLVGQRRSRIGDLFRLLSMGITQQRGRGDQCGGEGSVEAHSDASWREQIKELILRGGDKPEEGAGYKIGQRQRKTGGKRKEKRKQKGDDRYRQVEEADDSR